MKVFTPLLLSAALLFAVPVLAEEAASSTANTNNEILMQKIKADKKLLVASNMDLTDAEAKQFWPLYDAYQKELNKINERLIATVNEYAKEFKKGPLANDTAKKLLNDALGVQESELKLKRTYADKIGKVLPASKTVRYIQIENKIRAVLNAVLAQEIPLVY
jgi:Spy/CpxP family protein refolding chaperone